MKRQQLEVAVAPVEGRHICCILPWMFGREGGGGGGNKKQTNLVHGIGAIKDNLLYNICFQQQAKHARNV